MSTFLQYDPYLVDLWRKIRYIVSMVKKSRNFYLSDEALELIRETAKRLGLSQAAVVEMAVRKLAESEGIKD